MDIDYGKFISDLRSALNNLYEPNLLRRSPLATTLGVAGKMDTPAVLQKILIDAIEQLKPTEEDHSYSRSWVTHDVLFLRYVRGYSREAVASQLGISDRQLSREQRSAIDALSLYLWKAYRLDEQVDQTYRASAGDRDLKNIDGAYLKAPLLDTGNVKDAWVDDLPPETTAPLKVVIQSVLGILKPLIQEKQVSLRFESAAALPDLLVPQNALRQSLLILLGWLIPLAEKNEFLMNAGISGEELILSMSAKPISNDSSMTGSTIADLPGMEISRQFIERAGGRFRLDFQAGQIDAELSIPTISKISVLVVDDNPDTILLFQRYSQGTRYSILGISVPSEISRMVENYQPQIILLDIMMPEVDGWDLLTQLRQSLKNQKISILLCSILPMESLARSLGANGFLQKPVLPQDFIRVLDEQVEWLSREDD